MTQRSTKGASKQRRDAINDRISQMRELLPVSEAVRSRMSQLQVMALANAYIAKCNFFTDYCFEADDRSSMLTELFDFTQTMPGFLLTASVDGRILYISDNVSDYLGNSSVDSMTQLESVYDLIDDRDREILRGAMAQHQRSSLSTVGSEPWTQTAHGEVVSPVDCAINELSFTCRMNSTARGVRTVIAQSTLRTSFERQKTMQVTGRFLRPRSVCYGPRTSYSNPHLMTVFVAYCTPHLAVGSSPIMSCIDVTETSEADPTTFRSVHQLDMTFVKIDANGEFHLSCDRKTIFGQSWYAMIHPEDIEEAKIKHIELMRAYQIGDMTASRSLCVRVQTAAGRSLWLHTVMHLHANNNHEGAFSDITSRQTAVIMCTSHVIDEMSALFLRLQELETPTETAAGENRLLMPPMVCSRDDVIFGLFDTVQPLKQVSMRTPSQREGDRMEVNQRLKRKITDRQLEHANAVQPPKVPRLQDNVLPMDGVDSSATWMPLCSMPSPPMQPWDSNIIQSAGTVGQSVFNYSMFGGSTVQDLNGSTTVYNFQTSVGKVQMQVENVAPIPDSYVTPSSSPVTLDNSSTDDVDPFGFGLDDLIKRLPDDHSFFGGSQLAPTAQKKVSRIADANDSQWNAPSLPVLDLCSVASILGDPELPTPTSAAAPMMSEFGLEIESCRQQLSGGHVIVVSGSQQSVALDRSGAVAAAVNQPQQQLSLVKKPATASHEPGNCNETCAAADHVFDEQLICNLLALGEDFMHSVAVNIPDPALVHCNADLYQPITVNRYQCIATSAFE